MNFEQVFRTRSLKRPFKPGHCMEVSYVIFMRKLCFVFLKKPLVNVFKEKVLFRKLQEGFYRNSWKKIYFGVFERKLYLESQSKY